MKSLYQLHKAFAMRAKPDKPRGAPEKGESNAGIAQSILGAMERMREQRVKQLASRIAGSALGLGGHWKQVERHDGEKRMRLGKDGTPQMKWVWMEEPSAKYPHCHAVVIENLTNYRPDELQTRRENRRLMDWSSSKVRKYLFEACQLHGLHLREVQAGYTSRQDSRTGAPGIRCTDVSVTDFMSKPWWRRQVDIAKEKTGHGKGDAREQYLTDLDAKWSVASDAERKSAPPLRMPVQGGELFVSADPHSPSAKGLQADLNAAANIGLKALLDPDWPGKWWYVPCSTKDGQPSQDKVKGAACINLEETICDPANESSEKNNGNAKKKEIVNVWRDPSAASMVGSWQRTPAYWNMVRSRVVDVLRHVNGLVTPEKNAVESTEVPW
jgi:IS605 OrfB family transposase